MTDWAITTLGPYDRQAVMEAVDLFETVLGHGMLTVDQVLEELRTGSLLFLTAHTGRPATVAGAAIARVLHDDDYREFIAPMPHGTLLAVPPSVDGRRIGQLNTLAVAEPMRRRGLGGALTARSTAWLRERCTQAYVISWLHDRPGRSEGPLKALGWEPVTVLHDYWLHSGWDCSRCGRPCHCPGMLLRLLGTVKAP